MILSNKKKKKQIDESNIMKLEQDKQHLLEF